jgi:hypothetical protein
MSSSPTGRNGNPSATRAGAFEAEAAVGSRRKGKRDTAGVLQLSASDNDGLRDVTGEIHDWFFDLEDVNHDAAARMVVIPFRRWSYEEAVQIKAAHVAKHRKIFQTLRSIEWEAPWYRWYLRVEFASGLEIEDEAEVGGADFNAIAFDAARRRVEIKCNLPVTLRIHVDTLSVQLEETDEKIGRARYRTRGDREFATSYSGQVHPL